MPHWSFRTAVGCCALTLALAAAAARADDVPDAAALERQFRTVADRVAPAVVAISASTEANDDPGSRRVAELNTDKLQAFLARTTRVVGTGFVYTPDGYVLTNDHVVDEAAQLWVTTDDRRVYPAVVVGTDPRSDLAVLKVPGHGMPTVHFGDGGHACRGQWSIAIGNPYGLSAGGGMCVSVGVVSATHRSLSKLSERENRLYNDLLQTTAQINPGNSGGPLFDLRGDVIGINTAVVLPQQTSAGTLNGIGFALPVDAQLRSTVAHLQRGDEMPWGYLGVVVSDPTDRQRQESGLADGAGVCVDDVRPDSPAVRVLQDGDVILSLDGRPVADSGDFVRQVGSTATDRAVAVSVLRQGHTVAQTVRLRRRPLPEPAVTRATQRLRWGGMTVVRSADGTALTVAHVDLAGPFASVKEGATLRTVAGRPVRSIVALQDVINDVPLDQCALGVVDPAAADATASIGE